MHTVRVSDQLARHLTSCFTGSLFILFGCLGIIWLGEFLGLAHILVMFLRKRLPIPAVILATVKEGFQEWLQVCKSLDWGENNRKITQKTI